MFYVARIDENGMCIGGYGNSNPQPLESNEVEVNSDPVMFIGRHWNGVSFDAATPAPKVLSKTDFRAFAVTQLGGSTIGMARFQDIMDAAQASSGAVKFCFTQYQDASAVVHADLTLFLGIMLGASIITQQERDGVLNNWPMQT